MGKNIIPEGVINLDTEFAKKIGFTSDKFKADSYLYGCPANNGVVISLITSDVKGSFKQLIENIEHLNIAFRIYTPSKRMQEIAFKQKWFKGFDGEAFFITSQKPEEAKDGKKEKN